MVQIDTRYLTEPETRHAEYLAALADYRAAAHAFAEQLATEGSADFAPVEPLRARLEALTPDWRLAAVDAAEACRRYGIPRPTLSWLAREGRVRAEKRASKWYFAAADLEALRAEETEEA